MSTTTLNTKFQLRRDTLTNWMDSTKGNDPILADGEPVLVEVDDVYKLKIGDGVSHLSELAYYGGGSGGDADWATLLNKPFYEKQIAEKTYLVDTTKDPITIAVPDGPTFYGYHISSDTLDIDTIKGFLFTFEVTSQGQTTTKTNISGADLPIDAVSDKLISINENESGANLPIFFYVSEPNTYFEDMGVTFTQEGLYGIQGELTGVLSWGGLSCTNPARTETKQIDKKYIDYDWDNIENKPFSETIISGVSYVSDFTVNPTATIPVSNETTFEVYKLSGDIYTTDELEGFKVSYDINSNIQKTDIDISEAELDTSQSGMISINMEDNYWLPMFIILLEDTDDFGTPLEKGVYGVQGSVTGVDFIWKGLELKKPNTSIIQKLDKKYTYSSWNELDDKPFGDITHDSVSYTIPKDNTDYIPGISSFRTIKKLYAVDLGDAPEVIPMKGYYTNESSNSTTLYEWTSDDLQTTEGNNYMYFTYTPPNQSFTFEAIMVGSDNTPISELNDLQVNEGLYGVVTEIKAINDSNDRVNTDIIQCYQINNVIIDNSQTPDYTFDNNYARLKEYYYKVPNLAPLNSDNIVGGTIKTNFSSGGSGTQTIDSSMINEYDNYFTISDYVYSIEENATGPLSPQMTSGVYLKKEYSQSGVGDVSSSTTELIIPAYTEIKTIDPKYLPSGSSSQPSGGNSDSASVSSWNDLTDKPFESTSYSAITLNFSKLSTTDYEVTIDGNTTTLSLYKVCDDFVPEDELDYWVASNSQMGNIPFSQIISDPPTKNNNNSFVIDLTEGQMGYIISIEKDNDPLTITGLSLNKGFYFDSAFVNTIVTTSGFTLGRLEHESVKQLDSKYVDYSNIDYTILKNRPFMDIETESFDTMALSTSFSTNSLQISLNDSNYNYYKISNKYLTQEEAYGTAATFYPIIKDSDNSVYLNGYSRSYSNQNNKSIKIKYITGKKNNQSYEYIAGYINDISKNPAFISLPQNFDGYIKIDDSNKSLTSADGGTYVLLYSYDDKYSGIYSLIGSSFTTQKIIDEQYLDTSKNYNLLEGQPFGKYYIKRTSLIPYYLYDNKYGFTLNNAKYHQNNIYMYYIGAPLDLNQLYNLTCRFEDSITPDPTTDLLAESTSYINFNTIDNDCIVKTHYTKSGYYYAIYKKDFKIHTSNGDYCQPLLISVPTNYYDNIYFDSQELSNNTIPLSAGTYVIYYENYATNLLQGITRYVQRSAYYMEEFYIKKLDSDYINWNEVILTPETKIRKPMFLIENVQNTYNYTYFIEDSMENYYDKVITCAYHSGNYGVAKLTITVPEACNLYLRVQSPNSDGYTYVSSPVLLENDIGCPFSTDANTESTAWITKSGSGTSNYSQSLASGVYICYIKHCGGSNGAGNINLKLSTESSSSTTDKITKETIISLKEYVQELVNEMLGN